MRCVALEACARLEQEAVFRGKLRFDRSAIEVFVNDRLLAPNNDETWQALLPELAYFILFLPMVLVLVLRPQGLFGGQIL